MTTPTKHFGLRIPLQLSERLEEIARREGNHLSSVARRLLTSALDQEDAGRQTQRDSKRRSA